MAKGNANKYESYKAAWQRIRASQDADFPLEAVALQESIISDRLISFLSRPAAQRPLAKNKKDKWPQFKELIDRWRKEFPDGLAVDGYPDLIDAVNDWRNERNEVLHSLVKSDPGTPTVEVSAFLTKARLAAASGTSLARAVLDWHKAQKAAGA
jgi:hypothetical protein